MKRGTSRRDFLKTTTAAGVGYWVAGGVSPKVSHAAIETVNFASVGVGGKGDSDSGDAGRSGNMVAICDIDDNTLNKAAAKFPKAEKFNDYRKMLDKLGKSIDAVTVSTPDHMHAPVSVAAMKLGKHVFCQKPMTHSISETRIMGNLARENKLATQMGNQGTASGSLREGAAVARSGVLGTVSAVHVWTNRPIWPQGLSSKDITESDAPSHVHWDEWVGCAEMRPYSSAYHPFKWRGWWDFGTGALGDMACHTLNMPYMALDLKDPVSVQAETSGHNKQTYPGWSVITYEYPANNVRPAVTLVWYDGKKLPPKELFFGKNVPSSGALIIGDKGSLFSPGDYAGNFELLGDITKPDVDYPRSPGHFEEWVRAIKGGEPAMSNFPGYASGLTETVLLGNLAVWVAAEPGLGKKVMWDAKKMEATNAPEVAHVITPEYREGYSV
jgi:predicted dehydrogenase